ncbi:protein of unknown function [Pseudomonas sp. JV241A]|nr:protein of unknown function [Pseudomonas sp. JV241A]
MGRIIGNLIGCPSPNKRCPAVIDRCVALRSLCLMCLRRHDRQGYIYLTHRSGRVEFNWPIPNRWSDVHHDILSP